MVLSGTAFLLFFCVIFALWQLCPPRWRWAALLASNAGFYALGATPTLWWALGCSILLSWGIGLALPRVRSLAARRALLGIGLAGLLGFLLAFKYLGFFTGGRYNLYTMYGLAQPIGISFYTLQTLGYLLDIYAGRLAPEPHLGFYAAYVSFFATLTSGPVTAAQRLLPQLHDASMGKRPFDPEQASLGLMGVIFGIFEKCALADFIGARISVLTTAPHTVTGQALLLGSLLYSLQIYFDFAGYSNMALGFGRMLGLELEQNFRQPYFATSMKDFWNRWHLSLSHWLRDHVYFPLGGSRCGAARVAINLMLTFLVSGLWHGAGLCFLVWGALHGLYQVVGRFTLPARTRLLSRVGIRQQNPLLCLWRAGWVFLLASFAWLFFNVGTAGGSLSDVFSLLHCMIFDASYTLRGILDGLAILDISKAAAPRLLALFLLVAVPDWFGRRSDPVEWLYRRPAALRTALCWVYLIGILLFHTGTESFIYFAF